MKSKSNVPRVPDPLPTDLEEPASVLVDAWIRYSRRPQVKASVAIRWHEMLKRWMDDSAIMPLLVRKESSNWGGYIKNHPARKSGIAHCDNSPAQWVMRRCLEESYGTGAIIEYPKLEALILNRTFPLRMVIKKKVRLDPLCEFKKGLRPKDGVSTELGYHTAHVVDVGLDTSSEIKEVAIDYLMLHFIRLMSPLNMMVVPMQLRGLADLACFRNAALNANESAFRSELMTDLKTGKLAPPFFISEHSSEVPDA